MTSQQDVEGLIQQTRRYEFSDGLRDLQLALLLGGAGITAWLTFEPSFMNLIARTAVSYGRWAMLLGVLPMLVLVLAAWGTVRLMKVLRRRWLWRQSGMVESLRIMVPRRVNILSAVILLGGIALGVGLMYLGMVDDVLVLRMFWAATGWSFGYTLLGTGHHIGLRRYIWLGAVGGILSTGILLLPLSFGQSTLVFGCLWCLLLAISGIATLRQAVLDLR